MCGKQTDQDHSFRSLHYLYQCASCQPQQNKTKTGPMTKFRINLNVLMFYILVSNVTNFTDTYKTMTKILFHAFKNQCHTLEEA